MLSAISLANFKCFRRQHIDLKALTVLSGLNGMGKSSVIQAVLLLRQSFAEKVNNRLQLSGELIDLGTGADVFFDIADEDELLIALEFFDGSMSTRSEYRFEYDRSAEALRAARRGSNGLPARASLMVRGSQGDWEEASQSQRMQLRRPLASVYSPAGFHYLSAERLGPRKALPASEEQVRRRQLGTQGEYVLHFLEQRGDEPFSEADPRFFSSELATTLGAQVVGWLQETSPGTQLEIRHLRDIDALTARYSHQRAGDVPSKPFRSTNVGFGLSYVLPVLVALLSARPRDLVIIENPEAHLHPRGQTRLGQLAARAAAAGVQVIIETHSDHFLDGVRIDVRDQKLSHEDVALHYFTRHGGESAMVSPTIAKDGRLSEWPEGFFDEHDENLVRLLAKPQV